MTANLQPICLSHFKSDFDAVKSKVGLIYKQIKTSFYLPSPLGSPPLLSVCFPLGYLRCFKSGLEAIKSNVGLLNE